MWSHYRYPAWRLGDDRAGNRADQPALEQAMATMADDNVVDAVVLGVEHDGFGRGPNLDLKMRRQPTDLGFERLQEVSMMAAGLLDHRLGFHFLAEIRRASHRQHIQLRAVFPGEVEGKIEGGAGRVGTVVGNKQFVNHGLSP